MARAPTDVLRLAVAVVSLLVVMVVGARFGESVVRFVARLVNGIETLPSWLVTGVVLFGQILGVVVIVGGTAAAIWKRRWSLLAVAAGAAATAVVLTLLIRPLVDRFTAHVAPVDTSYTLVAPDRVRVPAGPHNFSRPWSPPPRRGSDGDNDAPRGRSSSLPSSHDCSVRRSDSTRWSRSSRAGPRARPPSLCSAHPRVARRVVRSQTVWLRSAYRCRGWSRPASTRAARRRTSPSAATVKHCS